MQVRQPPSGTVTFLFTDIEGSTEIARAHPREWESLRGLHDAFLQSALEAYHGFVFKRVGDAYCVAFATVDAALRAALEVQRLMQGASWSPATLRVRMGLHTGDAQAVRDSAGLLDYVGYSTLARVQRVMGAANGEQVLLSAVSAGLVRETLGACTLEDLGPQHLKGFADPEHLWQATAPGLRASFPPLRSSATTPNNLPVPTTRFIGRRRERAECTRLLEQGRLVTLSAIGGVGKTRLAIETARESLARFPDGIWFVDLGQVQEGTRVVQAVAASLGLRERPDVPLIESVSGHLKTRRTLLLLDNCEHLLDPVGSLVESLLATCPELSILATSREGLHITGEQMFTVRSLGMPDAGDLQHATQSDAVALFIDRALLADPTLQLDASTMPFVVDICGRLDGIALAIELAAARVKVLTLPDICARLGDRFRLLTGGNRALPRQQTLLATLKWSYDLLTPDEQKLLQRLAVFVGGWTLGAATAIASDDGDEFSVLERLGRLADKSLIALDRGRAPESRYAMLETVRQYALDRIDADDLAEVRIRHARFFASLGADWHELRRDSSRRAEWFAKVDADHENILAAHAECGLYEELAETGLELVSGIVSYWERSAMYRLAWQLLSEALGRNVARQAGPSRCKALTSHARIALLSGRYGEAEQASQAAIDMAWALDDERLIAGALGDRVSIANARGDLEGARMRADEYLELGRKLGGRHLFRARHMDAELRRRQGDLAGAETLYLTNLDESLASGNLQSVISGRVNLGFVAAQRSDACALRNQLLAYIDTDYDSYDVGGWIGVTLESCAALASLVGAQDLAARFHGVAEAHAARTGYQLEPVDVMAVQPHIDRARSTLGETRFDLLAAAASTESPSAAIEYARTWLRALDT